MSLLPCRAFRKCWKFHIYSEGFPERIFSVLKTLCFPRVIEWLGLEGTSGATLLLVAPSYGLF